ncbi:hypothetical protein OWV82_006466 [Melia azedarach]|uniref:Uncharacterized protein n=1 Tax=Melia azedarach TaxID=155640 RepID=A0ACC1YJ48_MELAZ|nr:hypothetical protein OWV82_006466 [Melia azedarach]
MVFNSWFPPPFPLKLSEEKPTLEPRAEALLQSIIAESRVSRYLFSYFSLKASGLISSIPLTKRKGITLGTSKNDKKKTNFKAAMQQLTAFTSASGSMRRGKERIVLGSQMERNGIVHSAKWLSDNIPPRVPDLVVSDTRKKKRKVSMSIKGASSSALQVIDINAIKRDKYEHIVPMIKAMKHVVSRDWVAKEGKVGENDMLNLCSKFSYKMSFWFSEHRDLLYQRIDDAHQKYDFEQEQIQELLTENDSLKTKISDLDVELAGVIQVEDEVRDKADAKGYVRGFSDSVSMFKSHYPEQNLAWLDQALKVIKEVEGEESENGNNEDADNIGPSQGEDCLGGDLNVPTSGGGVETVSTKQIYQDDPADNV